MKFISPNDIQSGDTIAWPYDAGTLVPNSIPELIYYEVESVESSLPFNCEIYCLRLHIIVFGKSYSKEGLRYRWLPKRNWDLVPNDGRGILLISRKKIDV